jgi:hypothetical protein
MTFFVRKIPFTCQNFFAENTKTQKHKKPSVALALLNVFRFLRLYYFLIFMKYKGEMAYSFKRAALKKASFFLLVCCFFL